MSIPPTPTSIRSSSTRSSLYDRYASPSITAIPPRHHYYSPPPPEIDQHELARVRSCLAQKEAENATMKQAVSEWQAKVQSYRQTQEQLQGKIRCLNAEMEAMKKAHVQRVDEDAQLILQLSKEIEHLKAAAATTNGPENSEKVDPCVTAEETYKKAASQVLYGRKKADTLILGINDMVRAIEEELAYLENGYDEDEDSSDAASSISSPDTLEQQSDTSATIVSSHQKTISSSDSKSMSLTQPSSPALVESSSTTMVAAEYDSSHQPPSSPNHHHHHQQQQRNFRPRSQTMDTLVKKASMFLLRPNKKSSSTSENPPQQHGSHQPRPTPSCTTPHPGSSYQTSSKGSIIPTLQQHRDISFSSRRSSIQNLNHSTTTTSTPLVNKDKRRQSMISLPSATSQYHQVSNLDHTTMDQSSSSSKSRLMYHYQQQQHAVQEYYQRRRRSAIVGGANPPFAGGASELKPTTSEQWKISSSRR
ncbi:hypothetical protein LRAMOSA01616 [Lichtheimia ramosa]|uniref:Uncharacterized protein n=1 Tax=Lichtheimia ramosa TaxID=688394 RepID=A0A077WM17_9FUNG|nr:hypothetical protein LRAMOSA01616 [Lichtheimia ramosa]